MIPYDEVKKNDVYTVLVDKLNEYFTPRNNSAFDKHVFREINLVVGESFHRFVLRLPQQVTNCLFGGDLFEICGQY